MHFAHLWQSRLSIDSSIIHVSLCRPTLETLLNFTIRIGSTPTFLYFDLYLYSAYAAHYVYYVRMYVNLK